MFPSRPTVWFCAAALAASCSSEHDSATTGAAASAHASSSSGAGEGGGGSGGSAPGDVVSFRATGALAIGRTNHTATLLPSGKVAVIGGELYNFAPLTSIEVYDRTTETWTAVASLPLARTNHSATLLSSGKVLIVGGGRSNSVMGPAGVGVTGEVVLYDPASDTVESRASLAIPRSHHTATLLSTGGVLVVGGAAGTHNGGNPQLGDALASVELYDPSTNNWQAMPPLAVPRFLHTATLTSTGKVVVIGGSNEQEAEILDVEVFDPATTTWSHAAEMREGRVFHAALMLPIQELLVAAGKRSNIKFLETTMLLSTDASRWDAGPNLPSSRTAPTLSLLPSGHPLLLAGLHGDLSGFEYLKDALIFDQAKRAWAPIGSLAHPRALHTTTVLPSGEVLVIGGLDASSALSSGELGVPE